MATAVVVTAWIIVVPTMAQSESSQQSHRDGDSSTPSGALSSASQPRATGSVIAARAARTTSFRLDDGVRARKAYFEGIGKLKAGELANAAELFRQTVALTPDWSLGYLELGTATHLLEPGSEAAQHALEKAVMLAPNNARAHYQLGLVYERAGKYAEASASLSVALKLRADLIDARFHFGNVLQAAGDGDAALAAFTQVLKRSPQHFGALAAMADLHERRGQIELAEEALMRMASLQPHVAYHQYQLAQFYERHGQPYKAEQAFSRAEAIDPRPKRRMRRLR